MRNDYVTPLVRVWGVNYFSTAAMRMHVGNLDEAIRLYGPSDDRVSERNALQEVLPYAVRAEEALHAHRPKARAASPAERHTGRTVRNVKTGTTHFVNGWGELFCGLLTEDIVHHRTDDRATCKACVRAGDAMVRDGSDGWGGSPARRL